MIDVRLRLRCAAAIALLATACPHVAWADAEAAPYPTEMQTLESLVALASTPGFALLVEPAASRLALTLEGAVLREYPIRSAEVVAPRVVFWRRSAATEADSAWVGRVWHGGELDPPRKRDRIEFTAAPPDPKRPEGWYRIAWTTIAFELIGVLVVGLLSIFDAQLFPSDTVWSVFGRGYLFIPLVLPVLGMIWLSTDGRVGAESTTEPAA